MGNIFISYSHKDSNYVRKLEKALKQRGLDVWIDQRIDYGTEWPEVIQTHLDECEAFIVIVSENSSKSEWVQKEVTRAQRKHKPFFPLLLSDDWGISMETTQYVDVRNQRLPPQKFYDDLAAVTTTRQVDPITIPKTLVKPLSISPKAKQRIILLLIVMILITIGAFIATKFIQQVSTLIPIIPIASETPAPIFNNVTPTMPPATLPAPVITAPKEGDLVDWEIDVAGSDAQAALEPGTYLYVVVIPAGLPAYYVQEIPRIQADGTWRSRPVYIGDSAPASIGKSFQICAVLHSQQLQPGEISSFPTGPKSCITVKRQ